MGMNAEAVCGDDGLWRVLIEGDEIALIPPHPTLHFSEFLATELARGIAYREPEEWRRRWLAFLLSKGET
jgi:hypothetical protein